MERACSHPLNKHCNPTTLSCSYCDKLPSPCEQPHLHLAWTLSFFHEVDAILSTSLDSFLELCEADIPHSTIWLPWVFAFYVRDTWVLKQCVKRHWTQCLHRGYCSSEGCCGSERSWVPLKVHRVEVWPSLWWFGEETESSQSWSLTKVIRSWRAPQPEPLKMWAEKKFFFYKSPRLRCLVTAMER